MLFKALRKGDVIEATDFVANEETFKPIGECSSVGLRWNKTAYHPMYRKISDSNEVQKPSCNTTKGDMLCNKDSACMFKVSYCATSRISCKYVESIA